MHLDIPTSDSADPRLLRLEHPDVNLLNCTEVLRHLLDHLPINVFDILCGLVTLSTCDEIGLHRGEADIAADDFNVHHSDQIGSLVYEV